MTRVLSALLLIPAVLGVVWFLPPVATLALALLAAVLACSEYVTIARAVGIKVPRLVTTIAVVGSLLTDVLYAALDPRVRLGGAGG